MSYARFITSDIYMFWNVNGTIECCACRRSRGQQSVQFKTFDEAIEHVKKHREAGDTVGQEVIDRLKADKEKYGTPQAK